MIVLNSKLVTISKSDLKCRKSNTCIINFSYSINGPDLHDLQHNLPIEICKQAQIYEKQYRHKVVYKLRSNT